MSGASPTGRPAVVLLSGGLDSATTLAIAQEAGFVCYCLSVRYGQRQAREIDCARRLAQSRDAAGHMVLDVELGKIGGSALTTDTPVPKDRPLEKMAAGIPATYVPARNTVLLSLAVAWAETLGAADIFIGANAVDYSGYPDCRPAFIAAFEQAATMGTRAGTEGKKPFHIHAPLIALSKKEIILRGMKLGVDYGDTHSCYDPLVKKNGLVLACGSCDSCRLRRAGFLAAGLVDPVFYAAGQDDSQ